MHRARLVAGLGLLVAALVLAGSASAYEHRRGTPSAGIRLQYGTTAGDSEWHDLFDRGFGVVISARQYIARNRAVGLTAEQQSFDAIHGDSNKIGDGNADADCDKLQFQLLMVDYYFYFQRMARRTPYLVFSAGFYRPQLIDEFKEPGTNDSGEHVGYWHKEGFVLRGAVGFEFFLTRKIALDSAVSTYYLSAPGVDGRMLTAQLSVGFHLYTR